MRLIYTKPKLRDLSQGSRIAFVRQFRHMSQNDLSDKLGISGECKRRTMTRYEKGERNPKDDRTLILSNILDVNFNSIKKYDYHEPTDLIYTLLWLEELFPNYEISINENSNTNENMLFINKFIKEWNYIRTKRENREISYEEYINWKLNYSFEEKM